MQYRLVSSFHSRMKPLSSDSSVYSSHERRGTGMAMIYILKSFEATEVYSSELCR